MLIELFHLVIQGFKASNIVNNHRDGFQKYCYHKTTNEALNQTHYVYAYNKFMYTFCINMNINLIGKLKVNMIELHIYYMCKIYKIDEITISIKNLLKNF